MKIRAIIKLIEGDGWFVVAVKGSHRQYKHPWKHGRVTIAGHIGACAQEVRKFYNREE